MPFEPAVDGVIMCTTESLLIQVTVMPSDTLMILGLNSLPRTQISFGPGDGIGVGEGEGVGRSGVGEGLGVGVGDGGGGDTFVVGGVMGVVGVGAGNAGLAQAATKNNIPRNTIATIRVIRILAPFLSLTWPPVLMTLVILNPIMHGKVIKGRGKRLQNNNIWSLEVIIR